MRIPHHLLSLGREEICGLHLNTQRTVGLTYSSTQFYEHLQRTIRQNRIYLFLQPVLGLLYFQVHHRLFFFPNIIWNSSKSA